MTSAIDESSSDGNHGITEVISEGVDASFNSSSHAGLNALLSAVTLHISKSDEDKNNDDYTSLRCQANAKDSGAVPPQDVSPTTTTPTMEPEAHESHLNTFPGILMTLLMDSDNSEVITFLPDGKYFALRIDSFSSKLMKDVFKMNDYVVFTEELSSWGFSHVETKRPGVKVFRHKHFRKGDWILCEQMKQYESGTLQANSSQRHGLQSRSSSISEDDFIKTERGNPEATKRRLSPSSCSTAENGSSSKICTRAHSSDEESSAAGDRRQNHDTDLRSTALAITTAKLNIRETDDREFPLVQQAVVGATHTIVADAIECLLRDEDHTKQTFKKHAEELSKSSLPGLVPIAKQLFSLAEHTPSTEDSK